MKMLMKLCKFYRDEVEVLKLKGMTQALPGYLRMDIGLYPHQGETSGTDHMSISYRIYDRYHNRDLFPKSGGFADIADAKRFLYEVMPPEFNMGCVEYRSIKSVGNDQSPQDGQSGPPKA